MDFNLNEALQQTHVYKDTYEEAFGKKVNGEEPPAGKEDSAPLREIIRQTILDPDTKSFDKKRSVADLIQGHLIEHGAFYRTPDSRLFFFSDEEHRLYDLEQRPFTHLLIEESGLSSTETFFKFALDTLTAHIARQGKLVEVHTLAHYDVQTKVLTISDGGGGVWKREQHGTWQKGKNGDSGVLFLTEPDTTPWTPAFPSSDEHLHLQWFLNQINFCPALLSIDHQRAFFLVWLFQQFFPSLRCTRTIPAWLGPQGSGKSTTCRLIGRFLMGEAFDWFTHKKKGITYGCENPTTTRPARLVGYR